MREKLAALALAVLLSGPALAQIAPGATSGSGLTAGTANVDETAVTYPINIFTVVPSSGDARLPTSQLSAGVVTLGQLVTIINSDLSGDDDLSVWPRGGENAGAGVDTAITLHVHEKLGCTIVANLTWFCSVTNLTGGVTGPTGADGPTGPAGIIDTAESRAVMVACASASFATATLCCAATTTTTSCAGVMFGTITTHLLTVDECARGDAQTDDAFYFAFCYAP